ncbi:MAG: dihydropteroate synthase, partial [Desulfovibrio sp.]|nr:dihydropteroate synthase [Desulfovibrio sp.]
DHIRALKKAVEAGSGGIGPVRPERHAGIVLTSRQRLVRIGEGEPFTVIGERINPTGKPRLTAELQQGVFSLALEYAERQIEAGCRVLDVNVGAHQVDQKALLPKLASLLASRHKAPLSIDSSDDEAVKATLPWMPASCLVNSISGGPERMQSLGLACRDFGCPFILLPIKGAKLPKTAAERIAILEAQLAEAERLGIPRRLVMVDILALAVSSRADGAVQCLELLRWCRGNGFATTLGLSNLSFGLPARELVNATFLCMGAGAGLSSCIANPSSLRVREASAALAVLMDHDPHAESFIAGYSGWKQA